MQSDNNDTKTLQDDFHKYLEFKLFQEMILRKSAESPKKQRNNQSSKRKSHKGKHAGSKFSQVVDENCEPRSDSVGQGQFKNETELKSGLKSQGKLSALPTHGLKLQSPNAAGKEDFQKGREPVFEANVLSESKNQNGSAVNFAAKIEPEVDRKRRSDAETKNIPQSENSLKNSKIQKQDQKGPKDLKFEQNPRKSQKDQNLMPKVEKIESYKDVVQNPEPSQQEVDSSKQIENQPPKLVTKSVQNLRELINSPKDLNLRELIGSSGKTGPNKDRKPKNESASLKKQKSSESVQQMLHKKLVNLRSTSSDSEDGMMTLLKEILQSLSQQQKDQLVQYLQSKYPDLDTSKDSSHMDDLNDQQYRKIIEESRGENAKLHNSNKQQSQFIQNLQKKVQEMHVSYREEEIKNNIDKQMMNHQINASMQQAECPGCEHSGQRDHVNKPRPQHQGVKHQHASVDSQANGLSQLDRMIGDQDKNPKHQRAGNQFGGDRGAYRNQINKSRGGSKPQANQDCNQRDHRDQRETNRDSKQVRFYDNQNHSPQKDNAFYKKQNNWNNENQDKRRNFGKPYQNDRESQKDLQRNPQNRQEFSKPQYKGNSSTNFEKKERMYGKNTQGHRQFNGSKMKEMNRSDHSSAYKEANYNESLQKKNKLFDESNYVQQDDDEYQILLLPKDAPTKQQEPTQSNRSSQNHSKSFNDNSFSKNSERQNYSKPKPYHNKRPVNIEQEMKQSLQNSFSHGSRKHFPAGVDGGQQFEYLSNQSIPAIDVAKLSSEQKPLNEVLSQRSKEMGVVNSSHLLGPADIDDLEVADNRGTLESKVDLSKKEESKGGEQINSASHRAAYEMKEVEFEDIHQFFEEDDDQEELSDHESDHQDEIQTSKTSKPQEDFQNSSDQKQAKVSQDEKVSNAVARPESKETAAKKPAAPEVPLAAAPSNNPKSEEAKSFIKQFQSAIDNKDGSQLSDLIFDAECGDEDLVDQLDFQWYGQLAEQLIQK